MITNLYNTYLDTFIKDKKGESVFVKSKEGDYYLVEYSDGFQRYVNSRSLRRGSFFRESRVLGHTKEFSKTRIGEEFKQKSGYTARIIEYNNKSDITVQFNDENNSIKEHCSYSALKRGYVGIGKHNLAYKRLGAIQYQKCGYMAEVIDYKDTSNLLVRLETGDVKKCSWVTFVNGSLMPDYEKMRLGIERKQKHGGIAKIVEYKDAAHIIIEYNGGNKQQTSWKRFIEGKVKPDYENSRVGIKHKQECDLNAEVVKYIDASHVVVKFETGEIKESTWYNFIHGKVFTSDKESRYTAEKLMLCGLYAKVKKYISAMEVLIEFENGTQKTTTWDIFKTGNAIPFRIQIGTVYNDYKVLNRLQNYMYLVEKDGFQNIKTMRELILEDKE